jgi:hypothetical protein
MYTVTPLKTNEQKPDRDEQISEIAGDLVNWINLIEAVVIYFVIPELNFQVVFWVLFGVGIVPTFFELIPLWWLRTIFLVLCEVAQLLIYVIVSSNRTTQLYLVVGILTFAEIVLTISQGWTSRMESNKTSVLGAIFMLLIKSLVYLLMNIMNICIAYLDPDLDATSLFNSAPMQVYTMFMLFGSSFLLGKYFGIIYKVLAEKNLSRESQLVKIKSGLSGIIDSALNIIFCRCSNMYFFKWWNSLSALLCYVFYFSSNIVYLVVASIQISWGSMSSSRYAWGFYLYLVVSYSITGFLIILNLVLRLIKICKERQTAIGPIPLPN